MNTDYMPDVTIVETIGEQEVSIAFKKYSDFLDYRGCMDVEEAEEISLEARPRNIPVGGYEDGMWMEYSALTAEIAYGLYLKPKPLGNSLKSAKAVVALYCKSTGDTLTVIGTLDNCVLLDKKPINVRQFEAVLSHFRPVGVGIKYLD